ncbi:MAG: pseudouridine synthase [Ardenticatenaceae bacterium]|nr:pseudouridine synthase [Ardenticatenaceae bacterium]
MHKVEPSTSLKILYLDEHLAAVYKPAGLLVHRTDIARGQDERFALQMVRDQLGQPVYPAHRLDRKTAGILLFALDSETMSRLKPLFDEQRVKKKYLALVRGHAPEEGEIDRPLKKAFLSGAQKAAAVAKPAVTRYRRLETVELPIPAGPYPTARYSLIEVAPLTGRTHQIRRHLASISHPIVGDTRYGDSAHNRLFRREFDSYRMFLIAHYLSFPHPHEEKQVSVAVEPDEDCRAIWRRVGIDRM